jgi:hypothetical protein
LLPLAVAACATRTIRTRTPLPTAGRTAGLTHHGFVEGELVLHFTREGERAVAPAMSATRGWLRFGVPSLDHLNAKYHATALTPVEGEPGAYRLRIARDANVFRAAEEYGHDPLVARAEPNYLLSLDRAPEAPEAVRTEVPSATAPDTVRIRR